MLWIESGSSDMQDAYMILKNPYQGNYKKALFVCSGGILRSATASHWAAEHKGWNTRAAGTHPYALIKVTPELIDWADKVYFLMQENLDFAIKDLDLKPKYFLNKFSVLNIPDNYAYRDPKLIERIAEALKDE